MLYMMEWSIKSGFAEKAVKKFTSTGAPLPEGCKQVGRYHAPGSCNGWLLVETDDPVTVYIHASEWAEFLDWRTTPVLTDEQAGTGCKAAWSNV